MEVSAAGMLPPQKLLPARVAEACCPSPSRSHQGEGPGTTLRGCCRITPGALGSCMVAGHGVVCSWPSASWGHWVWLRGTCICSTAMRALLSSGPHAERWRYSREPERRARSPIVGRRAAGQRQFNYAAISAAKESMEGMSCVSSGQQPVGLPPGQLSASPAGCVWVWILAEYREP